MQDLFDRSRKGEHALLIQPHAGGPAEEDVLDEFADLARSAGATVAATLTARIDRPNPATLIGSGKLEEVKAAADATGADLVLVNHALSPVQERNLERALERRVIDRTGLILDIFAQRARSHEGKLQVELAQLRHLATRLVRGWTHLERQRGGSIGLRGPGETQLETDRRLLAGRIRQIKSRLARVDRTREQGRAARRKADMPTVSLVGYTNAGKSTLFNALTGAGVYAADQLFATLDPTLRRLDLPNVEPVVLADTVGFISRLPHELVAAFRSTLVETCEASLLLHVIDAADPERAELEKAVIEVLDEIGAAGVARLPVYNKIDLLDHGEPRIERDDAGLPVAVWLSAAGGGGLQELRQAIAELLRADTLRGTLELGAGQARLRARLFALGAVLSEEAGADGGCRLQVSASRKHLRQLCRQEGLVEGWLEAAVH